MSRYIKLLATGGTIAGLSKKQGGYEAGLLDADQLLERLPPLPMAVRAEQVMNMDSRDVTPEQWLLLARTVEQNLAQNDIAGVVITHGTDTLEETAFFLSQAVNAPKPVVLTGAMRPADSPGYDGAYNLHQALLLAGHPAMHGVMALMHDVIYSGRDIVKSNASQLNAFSASYHTLGQMLENGPRLFAARPQESADFTLKDVIRLLPVPLVYGYAGLEPAGLDYLLNDNNIKGLVYAAPGNGSVAARLHAILARATAQGVAVVVAARAGQGWVEPLDADPLFISAGPYNPLQARIRLMLGLSCGLCLRQIREFFKK